MMCKKLYNAALLLISSVTINQLSFGSTESTSLIGSIRNVSKSVKKLKNDWKAIPDKGLQLKLKQAEEEGKPATLTLSEIPGFGEIALPESLVALFSSLKITDLLILGSNKLLDIQGTSVIDGKLIYVHIRIEKKGITKKEKDDATALIENQITLLESEIKSEMTTLEGYYHTLGLTPQATKAEVKSAYKKLALIWHPDKAPAGDTEKQAEHTQKMQEINEAYNQIKDRDPSQNTEEALAQSGDGTTSAIDSATGQPLMIEGPTSNEPSSAYDWSFLINVPETFQLTNISTSFEPVNFEVKEGTFALSTVKFEDKKAGTIEAGCTFAGEFIAHGELEKMLNMVGSNLNKVILKGLITPKITGSYLKANIPGRLQFGDKAETTGLTLGIRAVESAPGIKGAELLINTGLQVQFPEQKPVIFSTEITASPIEASLSGSMLGTITIPNTSLYIGNLGVKGVINYAAAAASGGALSISGLGFGGTLGVGSREVNLALYMAVNALLASGSFTGGLYLKDIVALLSDTIKREEKKDLELDEQFDSSLPNIGIDQAKIEVASQDINFNNNVYEQGALFDGEGVLLDSKVSLKVHLTKSKLNVQGYLEPIIIGPLAITGAGKDGVFGTEDDGAFLDIKVDPKTTDAKKLFQGIIDGQVTFIFGSDSASAYTRIELKPTEALVRLELALLEIFTTKLNATLNLETPKKSSIDLLMEQSALDKLSQKLRQAAQDVLDSYEPAARRYVETRRRICEGLIPFSETEPYMLAEHAVQKAIAALPEGDDKALKEFVTVLTTNQDKMQEQIIPTLPPGDAIVYAWEVLEYNIPSLAEDIIFYKEDPNRMNIIWAATAPIAELGNAKVERLLAEDVSVDTTDIHGKSLLLLATERSNTELVTLLLEKKATVDAVDPAGMTVLMHALHSPTITQRLVNAGANVNAQDNSGVSVLDYALKDSHSDALSAIVNAGAGGGKTAVIELIKQRFAKALQDNDVDTAQALITTAYFDVLSRDSSGRTTTIQAMQDTSDAQARYKIVRALLQAGINEDLANYTDTKGVTPLVYAIQINDPDIVAIILEYKADPWNKVAEKTPLDYANETQNQTIIDAISNAMKESLQQTIIPPSTKTVQLRDELEKQRMYVRTYKKWQQPNPFRNALITAKPEDINFVGDGVEPLLFTAIGNEDYVAVADLLEFKANPNIVWQEKSALTHALDKKASIKRGYPTTNIDRIIQSLKGAGALE